MMPPLSRIRYLHSLGASTGPVFRNVCVCVCLCVCVSVTNFQASDWSSYIGLHKLHIHLPAPAADEAVYTSDYGVMPWVFARGANLAVL